jgi:hypothetical protein
MSPREHVRLPFLGNDRTFIVLAREARPEAEAPGVVVVVHDGHDDDDNDDDDYRAHVLDAEDAAQFDELGGASPVPEGDDVVDNSFFGNNNEAGSNITSVLLLDKTEMVLQLLPELSDGSSSAGDSDDADDDDDEGRRSLGYLSGGELDYAAFSSSIGMYLCVGVSTSIWVADDLLCSR